MSIIKIDPKISPISRVSTINDQVIEVNGKVEQGAFDINEIDQIISDLSIDRKFLRNQNIGHTLTTYTGWSHLKAETGFSIWKFTPTNYVYNAINQLFFDNKLLTNKGNAGAETVNTFNMVQLYNGDSGSGYVNNTTEAASETGTEFTINNTINDFLYVGSTATFGGIKFEWKTRGSGYTLKLEYWNGSTWVQLTANVNSLDDDTSNFESDGQISWTIPTNWGTTSVNTSDAYYYVRISTTSAPTTNAQAYYVIPSTSVIGLLALSSTQILNEEWAWCSFSGAIYATIRNTGDSAYEGNYFITSTSSSTNLQNFFVYNHTYKSNYQDSTYVVTKVSADNVSLSDPNYTATDVHQALVEVRNLISHENLWDKQSGSSKIIPYTSGDSLDMGAGDIIQNASKYHNFGGVQGSSGYGFRDNAGTMQVKNSAGSWSDFVSAMWTDGGDFLYPTNAESVRATRFEIDSPDTSIDRASGGILAFHDNIVGTLLLSSIAKVDLSNLSGVAINTNLLPSANNIRDLGSSAIKWKDFYLQGNITIGGTIDGRDISADLNQSVTTSSSPTFNDITISSPSNIYNLNHDSFTGFVANEHIDWTNTINNLITTGFGRFTRLELDSPDVSIDKSSGGVMTFHDNFVGTLLLSSIAKVDLSNLNATSINADLIPSATNIRDLGSSIKSFANLYLKGTTTIGDTLNLGIGSTVFDKIIYANNGDANKPALRYNETDNSWEFSNDGISFSDIGTGGASGWTDGGTFLYPTNVETVRATRFEIDSPAISIDGSSGNIMAFHDNTVGTLLLSQIAKTDLNNLSPTAINISLIPAADIGINLGSSTKRYNASFLGELDINQTVAGRDSVLIKDGGDIVQEIYDGGIVDFPKQSSSKNFRQGAQVIPTDTSTKIVLLGETYDTQGEFDNSRFIATKTGKYLAIAAVSWEAVTVDKYYGVSIYKNGATVASAFVGAAASTVLIRNSALDIVSLNAGDYLEEFVYHNAGVNQSVDATETFFIVFKVG